MMTEEYMMKRLLAARLDKPPAPKPPKPPQVKADERFVEDNKPTVQIINEATSHNQAFARRMERETAEDRRNRQHVKELAQWNAQLQDPHARYQHELDKWWESKKLAEEKARLFAGLNENPRTGSYSPIARFEREMEDR